MRNRPDLLHKFDFSYQLLSEIPRKISAMAFFAGLKFTNNILRLDVSYNIYKFFSVNSRQLLLMLWLTRTTWKVSKYEVFSD